MRIDSTFDFKNNKIHSSCYAINWELDFFTMTMKKYSMLDYKPKYIPRSILFINDILNAPPVDAEEYDYKMRKLLK